MIFTIEINFLFKTIINFKDITTIKTIITLEAIVIMITIIAIIIFAFVIIVLITFNLAKASALTTILNDFIKYFIIFAIVIELNIN